MLGKLDEAHKAAVKAANDSKTPTHERVNGVALKTTELLLTSARYAFYGRGGVSGGVNDYRLVVRKQFDQNGGGGRRRRRRRRRPRGFRDAVALGSEPRARVQRRRRSERRTVGRSHIRDPRAALVVRLRARRAVPAANGGAALRGDDEASVGGRRRARPRGSKLSGTYKTAGAFEYQDDLGCAIECWCQDIPHGVLVFFPSYSLLDRVVQRWRTTKQFERIEKVTGKKIFQEPRGNGSSSNDAGGGVRGGGKGGGGGGRGRGRGGRGRAAAGGENALDALLTKVLQGD